MEYSINNVFINVFGEHELSVILGSDSHIVQGNSEKLHSKLIKLKDKLLIKEFMEGNMLDTDSYTSEEYSFIRFVI